MSELLVNSDHGWVVPIEIAERPGGPVTRGGHPTLAVVEAGESLGKGIGQLNPVVKAMVSELRAAADWPDQVEVEFAVKIPANSSVTIVRADKETDFRIALRWSTSEAADG